MSASIFKNYAVIIWRNIRRDPIFSAINVLGLVLGFACVLFSLLYMYHETSYESGFGDSDRIYYSEVKSDRGEMVDVCRAKKFLELRNDPSFSGQMIFTGITRDRSGIFFEFNGNRFSDPVAFTQDNFFDVFDFPFMEGDRVSALSEPGSVVITRSLADKLSPDSSILNKVIRFGDDHLAKVTGIIDDSGIKTHFDWNVYFPSSAYGALFGGRSVLFYSLYIKQLTDAFPKAAFQQVRDSLDKGKAAEYGAGTVPVSYRFQPVKNAHLSKAVAELGPGLTGRFTLTYGNLVIIALCLGVLTLAISVANYANLSSAQATRRLKEISLRKTMGAAGKQIFWQFLFESLLLTMAAACLAVVLLWAALNFLNISFDWHFLLSSFFDVTFMGAALGLLVLVAFAGGWYPALRVSRFDPMSVTADGSSKGKVRALLLLGQFGIAGLLIIVVLFGQAQFKFLRTMDLGYDARNVYVLRVEGFTMSALNDAAGQLDRARRALLRVDGVVDVSAAFQDPVSYFGGGLSKVRLKGNDAQDFVELNGSVDGDPSYLNVYKIGMVAGRNLSRDIKSDKDGYVDEARSIALRAIVITESAVRKLGLNSPEEAVNKVLLERSEYFVNGESRVFEREFPIVGVCQDALFGRSANVIDVDYFYYSDNRPHTLGILVDHTASPEIKSQIEKVWLGEVAGMTASVNYLPDLIQRTSRGIGQIVSGFAVASLVAIVIACLGLYAMTVFTVQRRTKEIGVRKVLGATVWSVVKVLAAAVRGRLYWLVWLPYLSAIWL